MHRSILLFTLVLSGLHCHSNKGGNSSSGASGAGVTLRIVTPTQVSTQRTLGTGAAAATEGGLSSLQYYIRGITLCKNATLDGSGVSSSEGCVLLYQGPDDPVLFPNDSNTTPDYAAMASHARNVSTASVASRGAGYGYIDLLDPNSRGDVQSTTTFTSDDVGDYSYGLVYWAYPIKVTASLSTAGGNDQLYTHDGNVIVTAASGGFATNFASDLSVGPASEAVVCLGNGGTWFKFQHPLSITQQDIDAGREFVVDLAFNPNGLVSGFQNSVFGWPQLTDAANDTNIMGNYISVPYLDLVPVPHGPTETIQVETYVGSLGTGTTDRFDVRVEIYSVTQDANHAIYGVSTTPLVNANTTTAFSSLGRAAAVQTNGDGSINLLDWGNTAFISNLHRQTTVGAQTTVNLGCTSSGSTAPVFAGCTAPLSVELTLVSITELDT